MSNFNCSEDEFITKIKANYDQQNQRIVDISSLNCKDNSTGQIRTINFNQNQTPGLTSIETNNFSSGFNRINFIRDQQDNLSNLEVFSENKSQRILANQLPQERKISSTCQENQKINSLNLTQNSTQCVPDLFIINNENNRAVCPQGDVTCQSLEIECTGDDILIGGDVEFGSQLNSFRKVECLPRDTLEILNINYDRQGAEAANKKLPICQKGYNQIDYISERQSDNRNRITAIRFKCDDQEDFSGWIGTPPDSRNLSENINTISCQNGQAINKILVTYDPDRFITDIQTNEQHCLDNSRIPISDPSQSVTNTANTDSQFSIASSNNWLFALLLFILVLSILVMLVFFTR